jgi:hypothetical protein
VGDEALPAQPVRAGHDRERLITEDEHSIAAGIELQRGDVCSMAIQQFWTAHTGLPRRQRAGFGEY